MMAPLGPDPQIVSKEMSCSALVARRNPSSACTTAISVRPSLGVCASSQAKNSTTAAPSRRCASRMPAISPAFLQALGRRHGSSPHTTWPIRSDTASGAVVLSTRTGPFSAFSAGMKADGPCRRTPAPRCATTSVLTLAGSMNRSTAPVCDKTAKACTTGFLGTSAPRMFKSQQIESGSVKTAASCPAACKLAASLARFAVAVSPARLSGCTKTLPCGAAG